MKISFKQLLFFLCACFSLSANNEFQEKIKTGNAKKGYLVKGGIWATPSTEGPFYHSNGVPAWDGIEGSHVYHSNDEWAWNGKKGTKVYFSNNDWAWSGIKGTKVYHLHNDWVWTGKKGTKVYHSNNTWAWSGIKGTKVYHSNNEIAWSGKKNSPVYDDDGNMIYNSADAIYLELGYNNFLSIDYEGNFCLDIHLGPALSLVYDSYYDMYYLCLDLGYRSLIRIEIS